MQSDYRKRSLCCHYLAAKTKVSNGILARELVERDCIDLALIEQFKAFRHCRRPGKGDLLIRQPLASILIEIEHEVTGRAANVFANNLVVRLEREI